MERHVIQTVTAELCFSVHVHHHVKLNSPFKIHFFRLIIKHLLRQNYKKEHEFVCTSRMPIALDRYFPSFIRVIELFILPI